LLTILAWIQTGSPDMAISALIGTIVAALILLPGFALGYTGGGDVKLGIALASWLGTYHFLIAYVIAIYAALLFVILSTAWRYLRKNHPLTRAPNTATRYKTLLTGVLRGKWRYQSPKKGEWVSQRIAFAPALGLGAICAPWLLSQPLTAALAV
jgi:prepilin peptidase CpaA